MTPFLQEILALENTIRRFLKNYYDIFGTMHKSLLAHLTTYQTLLYEK